MWWRKPSGFMWPGIRTGVKTIPSALCGTCRGRKRREAGNIAPNNKFVNFKQRDYDFKELERQLINK